MKLHQLDPLFNPRSIAVLGASEATDSVGGQVFAKLAGGTFDGEVVPVNPKHEEVGGRPCYASLRDVPEPIDLAVIATPASTVPSIFEDCAAKGVRHAVVISAGFGESGDDGRRLEREVREIARRSDIRFLGPNSVGLLRPPIGMDASFLRSAPPTGKLALVSQSGALCSAIVDWAPPNHLGLSSVVSLGNASDVGFGDVLSFLGGDPETAAILLYVEGVRDARRFVSELRAAARVKPVVVLKSGREKAAAAAASTHTGALLGSDAAFEAALERAGAVRATTFGQLFAAAEILSAGRRAGGPRLGIVTNGGGAGVLAADRAEELGVALPPPCETTLHALDAVLPPHWSRANPIDILGDARPAAFGAAVKACLADDGFDGVLVMLTPQAMTDALEAATTVVEIARGQTRKPVLFCWMGEEAVAQAREHISSRGLPDFTTPERAVEAFSYLARHERNQRLALETPGPRERTGKPDAAGARMIVEAALAEDRAMLSDIESKAVLRAFGIPCGTTLAADTPSAALVAAQTVGFPVAIKIDSPDISHKSDVDGVRLGIASAADVRVAFNDVVAAAKAARPEARIAGVTVEAMASIAHARELLVGVSRDPVFGPVIVFGAGGTMVELLRDSATALPPLTTVLAERLIGRTRVARLLDAFRNHPPASRKLVVDTLLRVSEMVTELPQIVSLDINPLLAGPDAVLAVDARIAIARPVGDGDATDHMAIAPYPKELEQRGTLPDGTPLTIRPIRPEDAEGEQAFVRRLSPEAKHFRFMSAIKELSPSALARFTQIDYAREMALIALLEEGGGEVQVGVARYVINPDGRTCEFAIVVSDEHRGQGLGSRLMRSLMAAARRHKLEAMSGEVLAHNLPMLELMDELGFSRRMHPEDRKLVLVERRI